MCCQRYIGRLDLYSDDDTSTTTSLFLLFKKLRTFFFFSAGKNIEFLFLFFKTQFFVSIARIHSSHVQLLSSHSSIGLRNDVKRFLLFFVFPPSSQAEKLLFLFSYLNNQFPFIWCRWLSWYIWMICVHLARSSYITYKRTKCGCNRRARADAVVPCAKPPKKCVSNCRRVIVTS